MTRLIDADVTQRQAFEDNFDGKISDGQLFAVNWLIERAQTIDAEHVLRCHACRFFHIFESGSTICTHPAGMLRPVPDGFCNYAQAAEEDSDV